MTVEARLEKLGIELPDAPRPAGNYEPWVIAGDLLFLSGQFPIERGELRYAGRVGAEFTEEEGYAAARLAAINVLAQIRSALSGFDRLEGLVRVEGHIASAPGWSNAPKVLNGASDLSIQALEEKGRHSRTAFTPAGLPWGLCIELVVTARISKP